MKNWKNLFNMAAFCIAAYTMTSCSLHRNMANPTPELDAWRAANPGKEVIIHRKKIKKEKHRKKAARGDAYYNPLLGHVHLIEYIPASKDRKLNEWAKKQNADIAEHIDHIIEHEFRHEYNWESIRPMVHLTDRHTFKTLLILDEIIAKIDIDYALSAPNPDSAIMATIEREFNMFKLLEYDDMYRANHNTYTAATVLYRIPRFFRHSSVKQDKYYNAIDGMLTFKDENYDIRPLITDECFKLYFMTVAGDLARSKRIRQARINSEDFKFQIANPPNFPKGCICK
jgi:hypothetical protein